MTAKIFLDANIILDFYFNVMDFSIAISTHKEFGYIALWSVLLFVVLVEMTAFHLLLIRWSRTAYMVVTVLSLYGLIFFIADLSAIIKKKVLINNEQVILRTGIRWRLITSVSNICTVQKISYDYNSTEPYFKGGISKKSGNVLITFKEPVMIDKLYGTSKAFSSVLMHIDDVEKLVAMTVGFI